MKMLSIRTALPSRGDLDWDDGRDEPVQLVEDTPPSMRRKRPSTTPSSMRHMNTTLKPSVDSENEDFGGASLLASTPAPTRLPRKIDELTRREIESMERQALTSRALDEIGERSQDNLITSPPPLTRPMTAPAIQSSPSRIPRRRRSLIGNKENLRPNGEVNGNGSLKSSETVGLVDRTAQAANVKNMQRPRHQRNDSMNLLKKLARVSSMSPSPARDRPDIGATEKQKGSRQGINAGPSHSKGANADDVAGAEPPTKEVKQGKWDFEALQTEQQTKAQDAGPGAKLKLERAEKDQDVTPMPQDSVPEAKTPVVTGGWIDSTVVNHVPQQRGTGDNKAVLGTNADEAVADTHGLMADDDLRRMRSEPVIPKSALEAIIEENKHQQPHQNFGESTIQSLEDIVHPDLDPTDTITFDFGAGGVNRNLNTDLPLTQAEKDRRQEDLAMEGLNKRLRAARTSIKDANRGLRRVENSIETAQEGPTSATSARATIPIVETNKLRPHPLRHLRRWLSTRLVCPLVRTPLLLLHLRSNKHHWHPTDLARPRMHQLARMVHLRDHTLLVLLPPALLV